MISRNKTLILFMAIAAAFGLEIPIAFAQNESNGDKKPASAIALEIAGERLPLASEVSIAQRFSSKLTLKGYDPPYPKTHSLVALQNLISCKSPSNARIVITSIRVVVDDATMKTFTGSGSDDVIIYDGKSKNEFRFSPKTHNDISRDAIFVSPKGEPILVKLQRVYKDIKGSNFSFYVEGYWFYPKPTLQEERANRLQKMNEILQAEMLKRELKIAELTGKLRQLEQLYKSATRK